MPLTGAELRQRPRGGAADHRVRVVERPGEGADRAALTAVRQDDGRVAQEPGALSPRERGAAEAGSECARVELEQGLERLERSRRRQRRLAPALGLPGPRAFLLAHVA